MPNPNRRYTYVAFSLLFAIWFWVLLGRPHTLSSIFPEAILLNSDSSSS